MIEKEIDCIIRKLEAKSTSLMQDQPKYVRFICAKTLRNNKESYIGNPIYPSETEIVNELLLNFKCLWIMEEKKLIIAALALCLRNRNTTMHGSELGTILNALGVETTYGTTYEGTRGVFKLISAAYHGFNKTHPDLAEAIAYAFTNQHEELPWDWLWKQKNSLMQS